MGFADVLRDRVRVGKGDEEKRGGTGCFSDGLEQVVPATGHDSGEMPRVLLSTSMEFRLGCRSGELKQDFQKKVKPVAGEKIDYEKDSRGGMG
jgi:hypothetical protein